jgi:hypothetical protein
MKKMRLICNIVPCIARSSKWSSLSKVSVMLEPGQDFGTKEAKVAFAIALVRSTRHEISAFLLSD